MPSPPKLSQFPSYRRISYIFERNLSQRKVAAGVVAVEAQVLFALITSEHCREHVFWQTCEIRLLLATDLNIFQWNSINEAAECLALLSLRSHTLTLRRFLHWEAKRRKCTDWRYCPCRTLNPQLSSIRHIRKTGPRVPYNSRRLLAMPQQLNVDLRKWVEVRSKGRYNE
jgi:hypothetical protein